MIKTRKRAPVPKIEIEVLVQNFERELRGNGKEGRQE